MPFDIDVPSGGGSEGPFIQWQAKEATDGSVPGRVWTIRDAEGRRVFEPFTKGVVLDIENMKTGWCHSTGTKGMAPDWQWNASLSKFAPQPLAKAGAEWKRGFHIPLAFGPGENDKAVWEQAQAGAWQAFVALVGQLKGANAPPNKLPVVRQNGVEKIESKRGITFVPKLEIVKWVDRPAALSAGAGLDVGGDEEGEVMPF